MSECPLNVVEKLGDMSIDSDSMMEFEFDYDSEEIEELKSTERKDETRNLTDSTIKNNRKTLVMNSISRSALSQRVDIKNSVHMYRTPEPFPVNLMPHGIIVRPNLTACGQFGVTNHSRTESLAQFALYRNQLMSARAAINGGLIVVAPTWPDYSPKCRGIADKFRRSVRRRIIPISPKLLFKEGEAVETSNRSLIRIPLADLSNVKNNGSNDQHDSPNCTSTYVKYEMRKLNSENVKDDEDMATFLGYSPTSSSLF